MTFPGRHEANGALVQASPTAAKPFINGCFRYWLDRVFCVLDIGSASEDEFSRRRGG